MLQKRFLILIAIVVVLIGAAPAVAITNGEPDNGAHPQVGLAVMYDADGNPLWRCSGTMIAPKVFLTAGHCTEAPAATAEIWFDDYVQNAAEGGHYPFPGPDSIHGHTVITHPQYNPNAFYLFDAGIILLRGKGPGPYAQLPQQGILDELANGPDHQGTFITAVGYGLQRSNPVFVEAFRLRMRAELRIIDVNGTAGIPAGTSVMLSNNADTGGTCFGDSGGPLFLNDTLTIVAVTSFGLNGNCAGTGGGYRIDQPDDLAWINSFLK
ncbi:MAG: trypsin-like serine protease [Chloroflexi bacterium]|nr:trypsin-like serine protease [Chloroflexota bacterium]